MNPIELLQSQFDKIYVLTIPRMVERHQLIAQSLQGLKFELFFGLDKSAVNLQQEAEKGHYYNDVYLAHNKDGQEMRLGAYCCAFGHKAIYQDMIAHNIEKALILEDDAVLELDQLMHLPAVFNQLPTTWELLYLGYEKNDTVSLKNKLKALWYQLYPNHALLKLKPLQYKKYYAAPLTDNIWHAGFHDCTHAYAITQSGAQKMVQLQSPIHLKSDSALAFGVTLNLLESYIAKPKIFDQLSIKNDGRVNSLVSEF